MIKNSLADAEDLRDMDSIPGSGRSPGGEHGSLPRYSCLENPMGRGAWRAAVHRVAKSRTQLKRLSTYSHIQCLTPVCLVVGFDSSVRFYIADGINIVFHVFILSTFGAQLIKLII